MPERIIPDSQAGQLLETDDATSSINASFGTWYTADQNRATFVFIDVTVSGTGSTTGEIDVDVDESGGTTADYTYEATVGTDLTGSITTAKQTTVYLPPGAQFQIRNVADPNTVNAIKDVRVAVL